MAEGNKINIDNTINTNNNDYIPDTNNNDGMKETIKKIIEQGKKVKVHGNEFDFARYNTEKIVKINGEEVAALFFVKDDTYHFIISEDKTVKLNFNGKKIKTDQFSINTDFSIERINLIKTGSRKTPYARNNYSYKYNSSLNEITNQITDQEFVINDYQQDSMVLTDIQKELFEEITKKYTFENKVFNENNIIFENNKAYFFSGTDNNIIRSIEKKNGIFEEKEYPVSFPKNGFINQKLANFIRIDHRNDEIDHRNIIYLYCNAYDKKKTNNYLYCNSKPKNIIIAYDLENKKIITYTADIDPKKFFQIPYDKHTANIKSEDFDKMLKKYFDKCVQEEKQKDNNEKEKNSKNNDDAKYSTNTEKSKGKHI